MRRMTHRERAWLPVALALAAIDHAAGFTSRVCGRLSRWARGVWLGEREK